MSYSKETLLAVLDRPIAFHSILARVSESAKAGLFLSQLLYWSDKGRARNGWIYKDASAWEEETCLTPDEQRGAIKRLKALGVIEVADMRTLGLDKFRSTLCFRINFNALSAVIAAHAIQPVDPAVRGGNIRGRSAEDPAPDNQILSSDRENQPPYTTTNTSEISPETTSRNNNNNATNDDVDVVFSDGSVLSGIPLFLAEPLKFAADQADSISKTQAAYAIGIVKKSSPEALITAYEFELARRREMAEREARDEEVAEKMAEAAAAEEAAANARRQRAETLLKTVIDLGIDARRALVESLGVLKHTTKDGAKELAEFISTGKLPSALLLAMLRRKVLEHYWQ